MIRHSFSILKGIGERLEKRLWQSGIRSWDDFIRADNIDFIPLDTKIRYDLELLTMLEKLDQANAGYFFRTVKRREHWRLFDVFSDGAVCLDIETSGINPEAGGYVTVVGIYNGFDYQSLIKGFDLEPMRIKSLIRGCKCLITFNGAVFDVPFLRKCFPDVAFEMPHFDLSLAARRLGIKGGLKAIERQFHIHRDHQVSGMTGYDAVRLWEQWRAGREEALDLLVQYNRADTINLMDLAKEMYRLLRVSTGFNG